MPAKNCRVFQPDVLVILADLNGETKRITIGELLPHAFSNSHLPGE